MTRSARKTCPLVQRRAAVIAAGGTPSILAVKAATTTTPIVFFVAEDPVRLGHVASLARPGGNLTGINVLSIELAAKRLELLRELVPSAVRIAVLVNPTNATNTEKSARGELQYRHRSGRACACGWLHAPPRHCGKRDQYFVVRKA
jgi:putative tryptophan/tyrosine transport system substrate-binding protein